MVLSGQIRKSAPIWASLFAEDQDQLADALPVVSIKTLHVLCKGVRMYGNLGMRVRAEKLRAFDAEGPITKSGAFGGAGNHTYMVEHESPVRDDRTQLCPQSWAAPSREGLQPRRPPSDSSICGIKRRFACPSHCFEGQADGYAHAQS
jgi:hypothetical protein